MTSTRLEAHCPPHTVLAPEFAAHVERAADHLAQAGITGAPHAVVLGSGLGSFVDGMDVQAEVAFGEVPGVAAATVVGHSGRIVQARHDGHDVVVLQGRLHGYEGLAMRQVVLPLLAVRALGAETVVLTNAAGGLHPDMHAGDLAVITDLIDLHLVDPLRGILRPAAGVPNELTLRGLRTGHLFDPALARRLRDVAPGPVHTGTYVSVWGPNYEPPLEIGFMRRIGGIAVGMSTGPEAVALRAFGAKVAGISMITNVSVETGAAVVTHDEVVEVGAARADAMEAMLHRVLDELARKTGNR